MATVKLPFIRFVKRVSNGASLSKYGYIGMMDQNADLIQSAPWVLAQSPNSVTLTTNQLTKTDGIFDSTTGAWTTQPTYTAYMADTYDCFKQAGDAVARNATMCGYAGCVAYRFKLPTSETANALNSISLALQRDRYLRAGMRVGLALSDSDTPSDDWSVVRGEATGCVRSESTAPAEGVVGVASFGFLGQPDVPYLTASRAASGVLELDTSTAFSAAASFQYLYLYITLEDPSGYWNLYKEDEQRQYYIEGSAMLVADNCSFTFANAPATATPTEYEVGYYTPWGDSNGFLFSADIDLYPQPYSSTDLMFRSTCAAPVAIARGSSLISFNMSDFIGGNGTQTTSVLSIGPGNPKTIGLNDIYSQFLQDKLVRFNKASGVQYIGDTIPAASFGVLFFNTNSGNSFDTVAIIRKKVLIPFMLPSGFRPGNVRLDWRGYHSNNEYEGIGAFSMRHSVWIAKGDLSNNYSNDALQKHEMYTAEKDAVGPFKLVGSFMHEVKEAQQGDPDFTETLDLPYTLDRGPYTFLLTAFIDMDQLAFDSSGNPTQHPITGNTNSGGIIFGGTSPTIREHSLLYLGGATGGGWSPTITLID